MFEEQQGGHGTGKTENLALTFSDRENTGNFVVLTSICIREVYPLGMKVSIVTFPELEFC